MAAIKLQPIRRCQGNGCLANGMCSYKLYDADVSPALISKITDAVMEHAYFHGRRSPNNLHRDRVITFEQIAE